ncbi:IS630 family transposase [Mycobacteroides stephanolepidis]|uniref:IS630 family transposase n=1 Tax=[Mycobacterium] stephanolepidis TaxID=1520670 RepID=A0A1Z4EYX4_9MYCO|nr:IS630 family transposase [[Mycobacterium] stephanolepidis]
MSLTRSSTVMAGLAQRARIVLLAADGVSNTEIASRTGVSRPTVISWRARYGESGIVGLVDLARSGRSRTLDHGEIVSATLRPSPATLGVTHRSSRLLADHLGISFSAVAKAWREYGVAPWRVETFKFSTDPELVAKVTDVVGLYLAPPENAVVLCIDEKSQIRALDRRAPMLPMQIGMPERRTHDYVRHGTTTLFAALEVATGKVTEVCKPRHRHQEFLAFLRHLARAYPDQELHLVMDNYAAHKKTEVRDWLAQNPRIKTYFTPTSASWMNLVEVWFGVHRTPRHPPWRLRQRPRSDHRNPHLHQRLEPSRASVCLDQNHRSNPQKSRTSTDFKHAPLGSSQILHDCLWFSCRGANRFSGFQYCPSRRPSPHSRRCCAPSRFAPTTPVHGYRCGLSATARACRWGSTARAITRWKTLVCCPHSLSWRS